MHLIFGLLCAVCAFGCTKKCDTDWASASLNTRTRTLTALLDLFQIIMIWDENAISLKSLGITNYTRRAVFQFEMTLLLPCFVYNFMSVYCSRTHARTLISTTPALLMCVSRSGSKVVWDYNDSDFSFAPHQINASNVCVIRASTVVVVIYFALLISTNQRSRTKADQQNRAIYSFRFFRFAKCFSHILRVEKRQKRATSSHLSMCDFCVWLTTLDQFSISTSRSTKQHSVRASECDSPSILSPLMRMR